MINKLALALLVAALAAGPLGTTIASAADEPAKIATSSMGKIWVDLQGRALYTFDKDTATKSNCNGDCATEWPPLAADANAKASGDWTIVTRDDGSLMWAYEGHPLYTFIEDTKPGDVTGDGKDGFHIAK